MNMLDYDKLFNHFVVRGETIQWITNTFII